MNKSIARQLMSTLLIIYFISYLILLGYTGIQLFFGTAILPPFIVAHLFQSSLYLLISYLIPLTGSGIILAFCLRIKFPAVSSPVKKSQNLHRTITSVLITIIALSVIYTLIHLNFAPSLVRDLDDQIFLSKSATHYLQEGDKALADKNYQKAIHFYTLYLQIDKGNALVRRKITDAEYSQVNTEAGELKSQPKPSLTTHPAPPLQGFSVRALIAKAREYQVKKDYLSAYYFSKQALFLDKNNEEARQLAEELWQKLSAYEPTLTEQKVFNLYADKAYAYDLFQDKRYLEAYYTFDELKSKYPHDKEIEQFLEESRIALQETVFFFEEIEETIPVPGIRNILFIQAPAENEKQIIFIGKLVATSLDYFFHDIEVLYLSKNSYRYRHFPYGKLIKDHINVNCVPSRRGANQLPIETKNINLQMNARYLPGFSLEKEGLKRLSLAELINLNQLYARFGYEQADIGMTILLGILNPCLFFIISLLSVSLGWAYRARYLNAPPLLTFLIVPAIPPSLFLFLSLLEYFYKILCGFFLITAGFFPALLCLVISTVILLFLTLFVLACQKI